MSFRVFLVMFLTVIVSCFVAVLSLLFLSRNVLLTIPRVHAWLSFKICGISCKVHGLENIDPNKSYVYVSNHASLVDIPTVAFILPKNVKFIAKKELFRIPLFGHAIKRLGHIPIDRGNKRKAIKSLEVAKESLNSGSSIWMAPEGTRSADGDVAQFKKGAFLTAAQANVEVVPVSLCGTWNILPKKSFKIKSGKIDVFVGKPRKVSQESILDDIEGTRAVISDNIVSWKSNNA